MSNYYIMFVFAFFIGQFAYTSITVYIQQKGKEIGYFEAYKAYMKKEIGWFVIALAGVSCIMFVLPDYLDLSITKEDLRDKEILNYKEKIIKYSRTIFLAAGAFIQHLIFLAYKKGKNEIQKVNDKISDSNG